MKCSNKYCKHNSLTPDDFYWHERDTKTLKSTKCKYCICEENKQKRLQEKQYKEKYFAW